MSYLRNAFLRAIALGAATFLWANGASATSFDATYGVSLNPSPFFGVGLGEADVVTEPTFELTTDNPTKTYAPLFQILALEGCCSNGFLYIDGDTLPRDIAVSFDFTIPTGGAGLPVTGVAQGHIVSGPDYISITWNSDTVFTFDGGIRLQIELGDAILSCSSSNNNCAPYTVEVKDDASCHDHRYSYDGNRSGSGGHCSKHTETVYAAANIDATFTLLPDVPPPPVTSVPLPGSLPLLASGFGLFALVVRRKMRNRAA